MYRNLKICNYPNKEVIKRLLELGFKAKEGMYGRTIYETEKPYLIWKTGRNAPSLIIDPDGFVCMHMSTAYYYRCIPSVIIKLIDEKMVEVVEDENE